MSASLTWSHSVENLDWNELAALYRAAPLGNKLPAALQVAFGNSMFKCFVREGGALVGVGRALADGTDCSYICDVAVLPSHQGTGLGKEIVARLVALSAGHKKIILYAVPGKDPSTGSSAFGACARRWRSSRIRPWPPSEATSMNPENEQ